MTGHRFLGGWTVTAKDWTIPLMICDLIVRGVQRSLVPLLFGCVLLAGCGSNQTGAGSNQTGDVGKAFRVSNAAGQKYTVMLTGIDPAAKKVGAPGVPAAGDKLYAVRLKFSDPSGALAETFLISLTIGDSAGRSYHTLGDRIVPVSSGPLFMDPVMQHLGFSLTQGQQESGWVPFEVPAKVRITEIDYATGLPSRATPRVVWHIR